MTQNSNLGEDEPLEVIGATPAETPTGTVLTSQPSDDDLDPEEKDFVMPRGRVGGTIALGVSQAVDNSEGGVSKTFFPQIMLAFGLGDAALGLLNALSMIARSLFGPIWALVADRFGRKRVLFIVTGLWGLWTVATGFANSWTMLLVLYSIALIGTVASEPILNGLLGSLYRRSERGRAYGLVRATGAIIGFIITPLIGQFGANPEGWRYAMIAMGVTSVVSGFLILWFVHEPEKVTGADELSTEMKSDAGLFKLSDAAKLFKIPTLAAMAPMLLFVSSLVIFGFQAQFWARDLGYGVTNAAYLATVQGIGSFLSALLGGYLGDVFNKRFGDKGRVLLFQLYAVSFAVMTYITFQMASLFDSDVSKGTGQTVTNDPSIGYYAVVFLMGLVFSIGFSGCVLPMVSSVAPKQLSATAFAVLFSLIQGAITAALSLSLGAISQAVGSLQLTLLWFGSVPYIINAIYWFIFYKTYPRDVALQRQRTKLIEQGQF